MQKTLSKLLIYNIKTIAFVDSLGEGPEWQLPSWNAEIEGYKVTHIPPGLTTLPEIVAFIQANAQAAVCAHRLGYPDFCGAELAATLYDVGIPTVLVTQYLDIDQHSSIRLWRSRLPVVLTLRDFDGVTLVDSLRFCVDELQGHIFDTRVPYRVMLRVEHVEGVEGYRFVDVSITFWDRYRRVRLPFELIPEHLRSEVKPHSWFCADVNVGTTVAAELYFCNFALASEPENDEDMIYCVEVLYDPCLKELPEPWFEGCTDGWLEKWLQEPVFDANVYAQDHAMWN